MSFLRNRSQPDETTERETRPQSQRSTPPQPVGFETVLGASSHVEGHLRTEGNIRLDGTLTGTLDITGNVLVGETAKINADIDARNVSIAGAVRGNVTGNKVQILRTGRVWGDITAKALTTEEGAFIDGKITMTGHVANRPEPTPPDEIPESVVNPAIPVDEDLQPAQTAHTDDETPADDNTPDAPSQ